MNSQEGPTSRRLEYLFDLELEYRQGMKPISSERARVGGYMGSGDGSAFGPRVNGEVRWDLYQEAGETLRASHLRGVIRIDDGAEIRFDALGFFLRPDAALPTRWLTSAALHFQGEDPLYRWLNRHLAIWEGSYDMGTYRYSCRVFAQVVGQ